MRRILVREHNKPPNQKKVEKKNMPSSSANSRRFTPWLKVSYATTQGDERKDMEDRVSVGSFIHQKTKFYVMAVMDGHGGSEYAEYVQKELNRELKAQLRQHGRRHMRVCLEQTFETLDRKGQALNLLSGTTASVLVVVASPTALGPEEVWIANVGDSSVYGSRQDSKGGPRRRAAELLSRNHTAKLALERKRLSDPNPSNVKYFVTKERYIGRVSKSCGMLLSVTRALGDHFLGPGVTASPTTKRLRKRHDAIVLASDGVWDVMSGEEVCQELAACQHSPAWRHAARDLLEYRNTHYEQHDNSSLIVAYFDESAMRAKK